MKKIIMLLTMSLLVLFGCSSSDEGGSLTIAMEASGDIPQKFEAQLANFTAETGIEVELQYYTSADAYNQMILGNASTGELPDIIWTNSGYQLSEYVETGLVVPIDEYITSDLSNYQPELLDAFYVDGKLYGLPKDYSTTVMYYNADKVDEIPTTSEEFNAYLNDTSNGAPIVVDPKLNYLYPFYLAKGINLFDEDGNVDMEVLTSQEHIDFLLNLQTLFTNGSLVTPYSLSVGWDGEAFANGDANAIYGGSWIEGVITEDMSTTVALLPNAEQYSMLFTAGWAVTKDCTNPEEAVALIEWLNTDEQILYSFENGLIGIAPTITGAQAVSEQTTNPYYDTYVEAGSYGYDFNSINPEVLNIINKQIEEILYSNKDITTAVNDMKTQIEELE